MKKNILVFVLAGLLFFVFGGLSKSANAQGYVKDDTWTTTRSSGVSKGGLSFSSMSLVTTPFKVGYATDVAVDSGNNIYVADERNNRILKFSPSGALLMTLGGEEGAGNDQFNSPYGVAVDASGNIYVADTKNHRVQKFDSHGNYRATIGKAATIGELGVDRNELKFPSDVAVDPDGNVYVSMSSVSYPTSTTNRKFYCIKKFNPPSLVSLYSEEMAIDCVEREFPRGDPRERVTEFRDEEFIGSGPGAITLDSDGNIYVATGNYIKIFGPDGDFISQQGGLPLSRGQVGKFRSIRGLDIAGDNIFITEFYFTPSPGGGTPTTDPLTYNYRFQRCNLSIVACEAFGSGVVYGPWGIAVDSAGNVFISDAIDLVKFKPFEFKFKQPPLRGYIRGG